MSRRRQLRLALSINGGASLAVWIGGAVAEINELRNGDGWWGDLLEAHGYQRTAQIDVITGASAGGLNAVLLAHQIRHGHPGFDFERLWRDQGDIDTLTKYPDEVNAAEGTRSMLRGNYFLDRVVAVLAAASADRPPPLAHDLEVFASATLVAGVPRTFRDVPGDPLRESGSDAYFHVARRGPAARGLDGFTDVSDLELARIARATSSLPFAFEPVPFSADEPGLLANAFSPRHRLVEVMDGGVLDNVPIARAVSAISDSRAAGRTRRVLLYLHPDPDTARPTKRPATALGVLRAYQGKRAESIREDIDALRFHNATVQRRNRIVDTRLQLLADPDFVAGNPDHIDRDTALAIVHRTAANPEREIRWHPTNHARYSSILDRDDGAAPDELNDLLGGPLADARLLIACRPLRHVSALRWLVHRVEAHSRELPDLKQHLYDTQLWCDLLLSYQLGRFNAAATLADAVDTIVETHDELAGFTVGGDVDAAWRALATWELPPGADGEPVIDLVERRIRDAIRRIPDDLGDHPIAAEALSALRHGAITLDHLDAVFAPLWLEPRWSDQDIDFVRIAGDVESPASRRFADAASFADNPKLAGVQLHHLGAFFNADWRTNDWWWGRLDAVAGLVGAVVGDAVDDEEADDLIEERQASLIAELEAREGRSFEAWAATDRRAASLIGTPELLRTVIRGLLTVRRLLTRNRRWHVRLLGWLALIVALAVNGVALAGRRSAGAAGLLISLVTAPRVGGNHRWSVWVIGALVAGTVAVVTERYVRPVRRPWWWGGYALAAGTVLGGGAAIAFELPFEEWVLPAVGAAVASATLYVWMPTRVRAATALAAGVVFGGVAVLGGDHLPRPLDSLWFWSVAAVVLMPVVANFVPRLLVPRRRI